MGTPFCTLSFLEGRGRKTCRGGAPFGLCDCQIARRTERRAFLSASPSTDLACQKACQSPPPRKAQPAGGCLPCKLFCAPLSILGSPGSGVGERALSALPRSRWARFLSPCLALIEAKGETGLRSPTRSGAATGSGCLRRIRPFAVPPFASIQSCGAKRRANLERPSGPLTPAHPHRIPESLILGRTLRRARR